MRCIEFCNHRILSAPLGCTPSGGAPDPLVHGGVTDTAVVNLNPVMPHKSSALTFR
jgi:hypothetical protein